MTMEIKDYYKYYLGCEVHADEGTMTYTLRQLGDDGKFALFKDKHGNEMWLQPNEWKMCLRRLSCMTEEENVPLFGKDKYWDVICGEGDCKSFTSAQFHYLLSRGFWLFGDEAFETGLIIEKK